MRLSHFPLHGPLCLPKNEHRVRVVATRSSVSLCLQKGRSGPMRLPFWNAIIICLQEAPSQGLSDLPHGSPFSVSVPAAERPGVKGELKGETKHKPKENESQCQKWWKAGLCPKTPHFSSCSFQLPHFLIAHLVTQELPNLPSSSISLPSLSNSGPLVTPHNSCIS